MASQTVEQRKRHESGNQQHPSMVDRRESTGEDFYDLVNEVSESCQKYCMHRPRVVAGLIFSVGFILGWKLRPW